MHPAAIAREEPDRIAYVMAATGRAVTYAELDARSNQLAQHWRALGVRPGEVIALVLENHEWFFPLVWSAQRAGLYYVCISTGLASADVAYILGDCAARVVVGSARTWPLLQAARGEDAPWQALCLDPVDGDPGLVAMVANLPATPIADEQAGIDMLYSSGTTGRPKGVRRPLTLGQPIETRTPLDHLATAHYGFDRDTRYLCPAPLYHAAPLRWSMVVQRLGGTVVVMDRFDAAEALRLIEAYRITASQWVPTHFVRMLHLPEEARAGHDLSSQRIVLHAAAPCPVTVKQAMIDWWGPILHEYYAGTENNGYVAIDTPQWLAHPGSVGRALVGEIRICGEDGEPVPTGEPGDIYFANGPAFAYHNDPAKTAAATNRHGWTTLGDVGRVDAEGYLYLSDRRDFMIISGGVNIYPLEIENRLITHPAVRDVAVIGVPDDEMGESVVAVIELRDGHVPCPALADDIRTFARHELGGIKTPRRIYFEDALPRLPTGKLTKRTLRDRYRQTAAATPTP